ncbi:hypothetical protein LOTGIDRAFT_235178 [Lottia gigantea]|uniref:Uncharacterized protein n=1 Tax=Lottia gigantea TaxID=225164 RepID=V3ZRP0_LOTGI|nr:hypothetical protein LOTGIDRAFT_235178 [Lottia gigantea]ESO87007.1 hypothetical protein LOTGIDRAFT_235178 [Lottia gigantea]
MVRSCLFLSICVLVLVDAAADWRLVNPKETDKPPYHSSPESPTHHHRPDRVHPGGLYSVKPSHRTIYRIRTTTQAFETDEFRRQNQERFREDQIKYAYIIIGGSVGGAVVLILTIVVLVLVLRSKRRRRAKVIEIESKPITNPRYQISIINPKLHGPPPPYDNVAFKNGNSDSQRADEYDVNMDDVKDSKFHHREGLKTKSSKDPKFEDLYNHLNATDVQNVHQNLYKRGDSTDDSTGGDEADNELSDEVEVQEPSKEGKDSPDSDDNQANTITGKL